VIANRPGPTTVKNAKRARVAPRRLTLRKKLLRCVRRWVASEKPPKRVEEDRGGDQEGRHHQDPDVRPDAQHRRENGEHEPGADRPTSDIGNRDLTPGGCHIPVVVCNMALGGDDEQCDEEDPTDEEDRAGCNAHCLQSPLPA